MKNIAKKMQRTARLLAGKEFEAAFTEIYGNNAAAFAVVRKAMDERTGGDFWGACAIFEAALEKEEWKIEQAAKSAAVKKFIAEYSDWQSGYSMGEVVEIIYKADLAEKREIVADRRRTYSGRARRFNSSVKHGVARLTVDLTGSRMRCATEIHGK